MRLKEAKEPSRCRWSPGLTLGGVLDEEDVVRSERGVGGDAAPREDVFAHGFPSLAYDGLGLPGEDFPGKVRGGIGCVTLRGPTVHSRVRFGRADQQVRLLGRHHVVQHLGDNAPADACCLPASTDRRTRGASSTTARRRVASTPPARERGSSTTRTSVAASSRRRTRAPRSGDRAEARFIPF